MKLYYSKGACSLVVRILINELQIPSKYESVNLRTKETETGADYYKINPKGAVPVLQLDNKEVLTENAAILQYLADIHKADNLLPPVGQMNRYRVLEWLNFISTDLHKGCAPFFNPAVPDDVKETVFLPILKNKFNLVEQHLAKNTYLMGDNFTLPDCYLFVILTWMPGVKMNISEFPALSRYFNHLKNRDAIIKSLKEEGLLGKTT